MSWYWMTIEFFSRKIVSFVDYPLKWVIQTLIVRGYRIASALALTETIKDIFLVVIEEIPLSLRRKKKVTESSQKRQDWNKDAFESRREKGQIKTCSEATLPWVMTQETTESDPCSRNRIDIQGQRVKRQVIQMKIKSLCECQDTWRHEELLLSWSSEKFKRGLKEGWLLTKEVLKSQETMMSSSWKEKSCSLDNNNGNVILLHLLASFRDIDLYPAKRARHLLYFLPFIALPLSLPWEDEDAWFDSPEEESSSNPAARPWRILLFAKEVVDPKPRRVDRMSSSDVKGDVILANSRFCSRRVLRRKRISDNSFRINSSGK